MDIESKRLRLVLMTVEEVLARVEAMEPAERAHVSAIWLERVRNSVAANPWLHGFSLRLRDGGLVVGTAGFKGPPGGDGVVEIAYGIEPDHQGKGYATEAAEALTRFAFSTPGVHRVRAHTLPGPNASTGVLMKCGFECLGEVMDPEDGRVWRWERAS
jgi:RimJ/RimL family protein N-acetyltransferase